MLIDPNGIAAFVAIASDRSFSRAAQRLGIAQSVISKRLRRLEDCLGDRLIDRSKRTDIKLTRLGELYLPEAQHALRQLQEVERFGLDLALGRVGPMRIGYIFSAAMNGTLTEMLRHLADFVPGVELCPRLMDTPEQLEALEQGELDVGLTRPRPSYPQSCNSRLIQQEPLNLFHATSHSLAGKNSVTCKDLASERFIVPQFHEKVGLINQLEAVARVGRFTIGSVIRTEDFVTTAALVASGQGVALAPVSLAALGIDGLAAKPITDLRQRIQIAMVYSARMPAELLKSLENFSLQSARSLVPPRRR